MPTTTLSIILPARNEAATVGTVVAALRGRLPDAEIVVVDDGSTDDTGALARASGARVIRHPVSLGNGAAIKTGARGARGDVLAFMDADGQHDPEDLVRLTGKLEEGYDLVVGARSGSTQASRVRWFGNAIYNRLAGWIVGHPVADLTSGFRVARAAKFREFLHLLPNGFSYPTTSTMCFFRAGYGVAYVPIEARQRADKASSHIRILRDGARFLLIIFRIGTLYSPLKLFTPVALALFLGGLGYSVWTLATAGRFTNFGALMFVTSLLVFFMGLISEQVTQLLYAQRSSARD